MANDERMKLPSPRQRRRGHHWNALAPHRSRL